MNPPLRLDSKDVQEELRQLLELAEGGDRAAVDRIVELSWPALKRYLLSYCKKDQIEDVLQEVYMVFMNQLQSPEAVKIQNLSYWLLGVARNCAKILHSKEERQARIRDCIKEEGLEAGPTDPSVKNALTTFYLGSDYLTKCINELRPDQLALLNRVYFQDECSESIADAEGLNGCAVRARLSRSRKALREKITKKIKNYRERHFSRRRKGQK